MPLHGHDDGGHLAALHVVEDVHRPAAPGGEQPAGHQVPGLARATLRDYAVAPAVGQQGVGLDEVPAVQVRPPVPLAALRSGQPSP